MDIIISLSNLDSVCSVSTGKNRNQYSQLRARIVYNSIVQKKIYNEKEKKKPHICYQVKYIHATSNVFVTNNSRLIFSVCGTRFIRFLYCEQICESVELCVSIFQLLWQYLESSRFRSRSLRNLTIEEKSIAIQLWN